MTVKSLDAVQETLRVMTDEINSIVPGTVTANITNSEIPGTPQPGTRRAGRPKDPNAKQVQQIALRPADWEYITLWALDSYNDADNVSKQVERVLGRLRAHAPHGPDKPFYTAPEGETVKERTTPSIAREAKQKGISKAALLNQMYDYWKAREE